MKVRGSPICLLTATAAVLAAVLAVPAGAALTRIDEHGTVLLDERKVFPIVLAKGPEPESTTPTGADALDEVVAAGVNFFKVGPAQRAWVDEDKEEALEYNRAVAARGAYTWVNLATVSTAQAEGTPIKDARLREVIALLEGDASAPALAMWKGADEPWLAGEAFAPEKLQYAYCVATSRGEPSWCGGKPTADSDHLWVTIQAPRGTPENLAPYSAVTDIHGVDHYPVTFADREVPNLEEIGIWTERIASITPNKSVWTTLQVCASGSSGPDGAFVLPTRRQERYMIYDAILNGARSLAFYGGNLDRCWNETDTTFGWSWTFWTDVLKDLVQEISATSPIAPALVNPGSTTPLTADDSTTQAISRAGTGDELWVIAARSGAGSAEVTISGLPAGLADGTVYTENRSVPVTGGSFKDTFAQWDVHVYRFVPAPPPPAPPPPPPAPPPPSAPPPPPPIEVLSSPDVAAPNTRLVASPARVMRVRRARFRFVASEAGSTFECKLDRGRWATCRSPRSYLRLRKGAHLFRVRARDAAGNVDPTPAARPWRIR